MPCYSECFSILTVRTISNSKSPLRMLRFVRFKPTIRQWYESPIIVDRKSKFQGRHVSIESPEEIPKIIEEFLLQHKSIAKNASHPHILAWRTGQKTTSSGPSSEYTNIQQGFKDNGESGAGSRLLEHLEQRKVMNKLVIVTRWYGGSPIGALRFRHILNCCFESLKRADS